MSARGNAPLVQHHRSLRVWQRSRVVVKRVYAAVARFPAAERTVLSTQMRRSAISISSNIAEGAAADTDAQFARFLGYALASASELQSQLDLCTDNGIGDPIAIAALDKDVDELKRMLAALRNRLT